MKVKLNSFQIIYYSLFRLKYCELILVMCFSRDNSIMLGTNRMIPIFNLKIGDIVKSIGNNGRIIDSEIVAILHINNFTESRFLALFIFYQFKFDSINK